jgi:hypothetical protein
MAAQLEGLPEGLPEGLLEVQPEVLLEARRAESQP